MKRAWSAFDNDHQGQVWLIGFSLGLVPKPGLGAVPTAEFQAKVGLDAARHGGRKG